MSIRSTLADPLGTVHRVTVPDIPADYPRGGGVTINADCGSGADLPAELARRCTHPAFVGRPVTCPDCLVIELGTDPRGPAGSRADHSMTPIPHAGSALTAWKVTADGVFVLGISGRHYRILCTMCDAPATTVTRCEDCRGDAGEHPRCADHAGQEG